MHDADMESHVHLLDDILQLLTVLILSSVFLEAVVRSLSRQDESLSSHSLVLC